MKTRYLFIISIVAAILSLNGNAYSCEPAIPPVAILNIERQHVIVDRTVVTLDGSASYDLDNTIVRYYWDFINDGPPYDCNERPDYHPDGAFDGITTHIYDATGDYTVKLKVDASDPGIAWDTDT